MPAGKRPEEPAATTSTWPPHTTLPVLLYPSADAQSADWSYGGSPVLGEPDTASYPLTDGIDSGRYACDNLQPYDATSIPPFCQIPAHRPRPAYGNGQHRNQFAAAADLVLHV